MSAGSRMLSSAVYVSTVMTVCSASKITNGCRNGSVGSASKRMTLLLVLDNCEHLVAACAELVGRLLRTAPRLRVLATSREVLGVAGEVVWPVPPLAVPDPLPDPVDEVAADPGAAVLAGRGGDQAAPEVLAGYDAVRLFADRAAAADPGFALDAATAPAVAELCRRLDGLPLAIELAAARVRVLPVPEITARLGDRFRLLGGGGRTADPRQRTLRAAVDWSWELLEEPDRRLWRRLAVFAGGWTVAAAEAVCGGDGLEEGEVLEGLFRLADRSLIVRGTTPVVAAGREPARFTMLESLRAYGAERLAEAGEADAVAARHTAFFLDLAEEAAAHRTARPWLWRVRADYGNLRAALDRVMAAGDLDTALRLAGALGWFWSTDHTIEGRQRLAAVLALADGRPPTPELARVLQVQAITEVALTPTEATVAAAQRSRELFERFGDRQGAAFSKLLIGWAELQRGGPGGAALRLVEEAAATFNELGDAWGQAFAGHSRFVFETYHHGLSERTQRAGREALERYQALDDQFGLAQAQFTLAEMATALGDLDAAKAGYAGAVAAARDGGPLWAHMAALVRLATLALPGGRGGPGGRPAGRGGRPGPPQRAAPSVRPPLQRARRRRPLPGRPGARPPAPPGGPGHRPRADRLERPPHPGLAGLRRGSAGRPRRRRRPSAGGGRPAAVDPAAGDRGSAPDRRGPGGARPRPSRAGRAPPGRRRDDPPAHRDRPGRRRAPRAGAGHRRRRGRARPGHSGRGPRRRAGPGDGGRPAGSGCQRLTRGRP